MLASVLLYLCLYPIWRSYVSVHQAMIARAYAWSASLWEHPRRTVGVSQVQGITVVRTTGPYTDFKVEDENLFIDLPMFFALAFCCPALTFLARLRMMVVGFLALSVVHFLGFALALKLAYVQFDLLNHGIHPGFTALNVIAPARRLIYSDLNLALPFLAWGALYIWEAQRSRSRSHRR